MKIELKLFASLRKYQQAAGSYDFSGPITVNELLHKKGVPLEEAPLILVNGIRADHSQVLRDGDIVSVFPLIGGG